MSETRVRQPSLKELAARCLGTDRAEAIPAANSPGPMPMSADLEYRIRSMARRWQYTGAELAEVLELARADPTAWLGAVALDEWQEQGRVRADA